MSAQDSRLTQACIQGGVPCGLCLLGRAAGSQCCLAVPCLLATTRMLSSKASGPPPIRAQLARRTMSRSSRLYRLLLGRSTLKVRSQLAAIDALHIKHQHASNLQSICLFIHPSHGLLAASAKLTSSSIGLEALVLPCALYSLSLSKKDLTCVRQDKHHKRHAAGTSK